MTPQQAGRQQRAFGLLQDVGDWQVVHGPDGPYWLVPSTADPSRRYRVTATYCTCNDFAYRGGDAGACKHMLSLRAVLAVHDAQISSSGKENA